MEFEMRRNYFEFHKVIQLQEKWGWVNLYIDSMTHKKHKTPLGFKGEISLDLKCEWGISL